MKNSFQKIKDIDIEKAILEKIKSGAIKRHSKAYFIVKNILLVLAMVLIFFFLLFTVSFLFFSLKSSYLWILPSLGLKGVEALIVNFPWILVISIIVFVALLEFLVKRYDFIFLRPLAYSALGIIFIIVCLGLFLDRTGFQENIYEKIKKEESSVMKPFYDKFARPDPAYFHPGTVNEKTVDGFILELADKNIVFVKISENTKMRPKYEIFPGGRLLVIGKIKDGVLEAEAIDNAPQTGRP